jgi:hypothetical protein
MLMMLRVLLSKHFFSRAIPKHLASPFKVSYLYITIMGSLRHGKTTSAGQN